MSTVDGEWTHAELDIEALGFEAACPHTRRGLDLHQRIQDMYTHVLSLNISNLMENHEILAPIVET